MLEFAREHAVGLTVALLLHVVLLVVLVVSLPLRPSVPAPGTRAPVQAVAVSESALRAAEQRDRQAREAEERQRREVEQRRQEEVRRQAEVERQREAEQQAQAAAAQRAQAEREERERRVAEERRQAEATRQAEEARKEQARREAEARQKAEAEARQKAEAEAQRQAEERARAEAARKAEEARQQAERQRQLAAQIESEERLIGLQSSPEYGAWLGAIQDQVARNWNRPASARAGLECEVRVSLIPGMQVVNAEILRCNGDDAVRRSIIAAVERASPLPRPSDPALFERSIVFEFKPED